MMIGIGDSRRERGVVGGKEVAAGFRRLLLCIAAAVGMLPLPSLAAERAATPIPIPNAGFEEGLPGEAPPGWHRTIVPGATGGAEALGYRGVVDTSSPREGQAGARLENVGDQLDPGRFGTLTNMVDATPYRGRRIRLTGAVRTAAPRAQHIGLWLRVDRPRPRRGAFDNMGDRPIRSTEWADYVIEADVASDAERIVFGMLLSGAGQAWLDDVRLEDVGAATPPPPSIVPPMAYLDRAIALLRQHHINTASVDWNRLTADAHAAVQGATSPADTYDAINGLIRALGERHTFLMPPRPPPPATATAPGPAMPMPSYALLDGRYGVVRLPGFMGSPEEAARYTATLRKGLTQLDHQGVCGWVVDLRENTGGNMWPMLNGLDPLLGEAPFGTFRTPQGGLIMWGRSFDGIRSGSSSPRPPAFRLRRADAPVAVLLGPRTSSSGEMTAMSLVGRAGTRTFGTPTAGFTTANAPYPLRDGAQLVITTSYSRDRTGHEYRGAIIPDEPAEAGAAQAAALRWLNSQGCR